MPDVAKPERGSPAWMREAQDTLGLSDAQLAAVLGYGEPAYWRRHKVRNTAAPSYRAPSSALVRLLEAYLAGYRPDDWPA